MASLAGVDDWSKYTSAPVPGNAEHLLNAASGVIRTYVEWSISREIIVDARIDAPGGTLLMLPTLLLVDVAAIAVDAVAVTDFDWSEAGMVERAVGWPRGFRRLTVSYTHGYETVPDEVKSYTVAVASAAAASVAGKVQESIGDWSATYATVERVFGSMGKTILNRYRRFAA
ncbi:hypothetical protein [Glycomyces paridis]|uniref:Mobile element protein n=1 Tax=Glycomyces paridis TaxID=2126555 RepID=A0A4S8PC92_9ACTN|nr:hypothetical protein [Glycomyces paridis]THV27937.1 hypothetical protein E9998_13180 [Glycomyces paridis]